MNTCRKTGIHLLSPLISKSINIDVVEKYIFLNSRNEDEYNHLLYQVVGLVVEGMKNGRDKKSVLEDVLDFLYNQRLEWNNPMYGKYAKREQEQIEFITTPMEVEEGIMKCGKCGSMKTISFSKQERSADEPCTVRVQCVVCKHKWREN